MEIKTKFNVGDVIWHLDKTYNEETEQFDVFVCPCQKRIVRIDTCSWKMLGEHTEINYLTEYMDGSTCILHLTENQCFATKEEAEAKIKEMGE